MRNYRQRELGEHLFHFCFQNEIRYLLRPLTMQASHFTPNAPGRLVQTLDGHQAFIPAALPGQVSWSNSLAAIISKADQALGQLAGLGRKMPNPQRLVRMFLRREAEFSSLIEQTRARVETMLLFEHLPDVEHDVPAVREVANNFRVLEHGFESLRHQPITISLICRMHELLFDGIDRPHLTPGQFRKVQNWIGSGPRIEDARYVPPPPLEVEPAMRELVSYIRKPGDLPTIVRCAMVHQQFEAIHPFVDGNGRLGRALILLMLHTEDVLPIPLLNPSFQMERNRREYYDLLLDVCQRGNWTSWIEFFAICVAREASDACRRLIRLDALRDQYRAQFSDARTSALLLRLIDELFADPAITVKKAAAALKINAANTQRLVDKLEQGKVLREVTGQQRNRVYVAQEIINLFSSTEEADIAE